MFTQNFNQWLCSLKFYKAVTKFAAKFVSSNALLINKIWVIRLYSTISVDQLFGLIISMNNSFDL